jgi:transposase
MKFVSQLEGIAEETLKEMEKKHPKSRARKRAQIILLSNEGYKIDEIADIQRVRRNTVSSCIDRWETKGVAGLLDRQKKGRPRKLTPKEEERALELIKKDRRNSKQAQSLLQKETGKEFSEWTFKRSLKRAGLRWKRMRKSLKNKQSPEKAEISKEEIAKFQAQEDQGECNLYYFDESGASTVPEVPYGWQYAGETVKLPASRSKRVNILGFCNRANDFYYEMVEGWVNSDHVIRSFDNFIATLDKRAIIIVDNASMHRSKAFKAKLAEWQEKDVVIYYLPPYSPELNLIEIVWRFLKYQWLPISAYQSYKQLKEGLDKVLKNIGEEYSISFA